MSTPIAWARKRADDLEGTSHLAFDPSSAAFDLASTASTTVATLPAAELAPLEAIGPLGRVVAARNVATAAGDALPRATRLAAGAARAGDAAIGGAAGGALASDGNDVGSNMVAGALLAPAAGAAVEHIVAPVVSKGAKLAAAIRDAVSGPAPAETASGAVKAFTPAERDAAVAELRARVAGQPISTPTVTPEAQATASVLRDLKPGSAIRTGAEVGAHFSPPIKAPAGVAQWDAETGAPLVGLDTIDGRQVPSYGVAGQPGSIAVGKAEPGSVSETSAMGQGPRAAPPGSDADVGAGAGFGNGAQRPAGDTGSSSAADATGGASDAVAPALGSAGAHQGVEATTDLPAAVEAHVRQLVRQGVPMDQALREADIAFVGGNAVANGARYFAELNRIGMPKLRAIFTPSELAEIASTGRAAIHLNSHVPGTLNSSNTASVGLSNDLARRMIAAHNAPKRDGHAVGTVAGASMLGGAATLLGHTVAGPAAAIAIPAVKLASDALARRAGARVVALGLADAADPAAARAAAKARSARLAEGLRRHAATRAAGSVSRAATTASDRRRELAAELRRVGR